MNRSPMMIIGLVLTVVGVGGLISSLVQPIEPPLFAIRCFLPSEQGGENITHWEGAWKARPVLQGAMLTASNHEGGGVYSPLSGEMCVWKEVKVQE